MMVDGRAPPPPPNPAPDLATIIGSAVAAAGVDRAALFDVCRRVVSGGDQARERLGQAVALAVLTALQDPAARVPPPGAGG